MYNESVGEEEKLEKKEDDGIDFEAIFGKFSGLSEQAREKLIIEDPSFKTSNLIVDMIHDELKEIPELQKDI